VYFLTDSANPIRVKQSRGDINIETSMDIHSPIHLKVQQTIQPGAYQETSVNKDILKHRTTNIEMLFEVIEWENTHPPIERVNKTKYQTLLDGSSTTTGRSPLASPVRAAVIKGDSSCKRTGMGLSAVSSIGRSEG